MERKKVQEEGLSGALVEQATVYLAQEPSDTAEGGQGWRIGEGENLARTRAGKTQAWSRGAKRVTEEQACGEQYKRT